MAGRAPHRVRVFLRLPFRWFARKVPALFFLLLPLFAVDSWANEGGTVSGTVKDTSHAVISQATVIATGVDTRLRQHTVTDDKGFYSFPDLPVGRYNISVEKAGFKTYVLTGVTVDESSSAVVDALQSTLGKSNYNALEVSLRHHSGPLEVSAGYTYAKSLDDSSNLGEEVNPINPALSYALSSFDIGHNFVVSYNYKLPVERLFRASNHWTQGWELSGITHFSSGLPVTLFSFGDNSLLGAEPNGINNFGIDEPDFTPGPLNLNHNPRNGQPFFNTSLFSENALGTPGDAKRRFFSGPGLDNYDMALLKNVRLTEAKSLQLRAEAFNIFNHAQFFGPSSVDGNISSPTFGNVISALPPRLVQLAAKFIF